MFRICAKEERKMKKMNPGDVEVKHLSCQWLNEKSEEFMHVCAKFYIRLIG